MAQLAPWAAVVVHALRNAFRFVSYSDRKRTAAAMRSIYTAPTLDGAELALAEFDKTWGTQYPGAVDVWRLAWEEFIPFLDYPVERRRIIYLTNAIESINCQMRKSEPVGTAPIRRGRGGPDDDTSGDHHPYRTHLPIPSPRNLASSTSTGHDRLDLVFGALLRFAA